MARGCNKYRARENRARIRDVLMHKWDPIGVSGIFEAADEYDSYIGRIYWMLLDERTNHHRIANHLLGLATNSMGFSDGRELRERCDLAATALMLLRSEFATH